MLGSALTFLVIALIAGALGFIVVAGTAAWMAKVLFVVFLVLFIVSLISGRSPTPVAGCKPGRERTTVSPAAPA
jgi:uncharacterized membrane protein YtjA (UPF0391 family)